MEWIVPLADLNYSADEEEAVLQVLRSRWLTMGAVTQSFELVFAEYLGVKHAIAVSNATQALHLACLAAGIGPGDEVVVPSMTFVATANAVLYTGADVRFCDVIGCDDLTISPESVRQQLTPRTKAIIVMHYAGFPCQMGEIIEIAREYNLVIIEDAAHSPGARLDRVSLGTWGDIGVFSFFSNKNLSTGEGGMLVTGRDDFADRVRLLRSHGMTTLTWDRHRGHAFTYDVVDLGYNYRIDEIRAALGKVQLSKLDKNNALRKELASKYREMLNILPLELPFTEFRGEPAYHLFPILLPEGVDRERFMESMRQQGVQTSIHYPPVHQFSYYRSKYPNASIPITEQVAKREVTLPLYPGMSADKLNVVVASTEQALKMSTKLL